MRIFVTYEEIEQLAYDEAAYIKIFIDQVTPDKE
jgi:hypothetical protein